MKITFEKTQECYWNLTKWAILHIPYVRMRFIKTVLGIPSIVLVFGIYANYRGIKLALYVIGMGILSFLITVYLTKRNIKKIRRCQPGFSCEQTVELTTDGFRMKTTASDTMYYWDSLSRIEADKNYIYMVLGIAVFGIPRQAFSSENESEQFFQTALRLWKDKKGL